MYGWTYVRLGRNLLEKIINIYFKAVDRTPTFHIRPILYRLAVYCVVVEIDKKVDPPISSCFYFPTAECRLP